MSATAGKLKISYTDDNSAAQSLEIALPNRGYRTLITLPFDIQPLDDGFWGRFDHGNGTDDQDIRQCVCDFVLTASEMGAIEDSVWSDADARGRQLTIEMGAGSAFYPFGPDKGPTGPFTVDGVFESRGIGQSPYKFFQVHAVFTATGNWLAYSLPSEVPQGSLQIGTVTGLRFPPSWFAPITKHAVSSTLTGGTAVQYRNRGTGGDRYSTSFEMSCNESKAAALIAYLTGTARALDFSIVTGNNSYPFDINNGASGTFTVCLIDEVIEIRHDRHNEFKFGLKLGLAA
jgi:hypothetical protein